MTSQEKQRVRDMRLSGYTYPGIAAALRLSEGTIKSFCRRKGLLDRDLALLKNPKKAGVCLNCGGVLQQTRGKRKKVFCSDACRYRWWNAHRNERRSGDVREYTCPVCKRPFWAYGSHRKYCSRDCYSAARHSKGEMTHGSGTLPA